MPAARKTFYQVLGVKRSANAHDIERAYERFRAQMQQAPGTHDARAAAMAKAAYATLSHPESRAEYDDALGFGRRAVRIGDLLLWAAIAASIVCGGWLFYHFTGNRAAGPPQERRFDAARVLADMAPRVGRLEAASISGQVRDLGFAVETGENQMTGVCPELPTGTVLTIQTARDPLRAELSSARGELCLLEVKGARGGVKLRSGIPPASEPLQALIRAGGTPVMRPVSVARLLQTPAGTAFTLKSGDVLPNGTPIFDSREELAGLVVAPQEIAPGMVLAIPATRIGDARIREGTPPAGDVASRPTARTGEVLVGEGFATSWTEDDGHRGLTQALDDVSRGKTGLPLAYWTKWKGVDSRPHSNHCIVSFGDGQIVADYAPQASRTGDEVVRYCALTPAQADLDDVAVGEYRFTILVDDRPVAANSIRIERRIVTPLRVIAIALLLVASAALAWAWRQRRAKAPKPAE